MSMFGPQRDRPRMAVGDDFQAGAALRLDGVRKRALETGRARLVAASVLFALAFAGIAARMIDVAVLDHSEARPRPMPQARTEGLEMDRADITDRNGVLLASSLPTVSLYAKASEILDPEEAATKLLTVLPDLHPQDLLARLSSGKPFVYLRRNLTPRQQYDVNALGIPGLEFEKGERRVYPHGPLVAHAVGMTDVDNKGVAGIEKRFDAALHTEGLPVRLSLDIRVQTLVRNELRRAIAEFSALGAMGMVLDVHSGEVLAMVSLPDFDPNDPPPAHADAMFNRATKGSYEMGSTFKLFNTALALDSGTANPNTSYDATRPLQYGKFTIHDSHPERRWMSVSEILIHSSNIGSARMAMDVGAAAQKAFMERLHLLEAPAEFELPEIGGPQVPNPWREINAMTIAFGHGLSVTPLQMAAGVAALVNGGLYHPPTLLARAPGEAVPSERVIKKRTSDQLRQLMRMVVTEGTGGKAGVSGYDVGGKTGTAEKTGAGGYRKKAVLASFTAVFPMADPRYLVLVMIDEPQGTKETHGYITAGWVAAPSAGRIIAQLAPLMGMMPATAPQAQAFDKVPGKGGRELAAVE